MFVMFCSAFLLQDSHNINFHLVYKHQHPVWDKQLHYSEEIAPDTLRGGAGGVQGGPGGGGVVLVVFRVQDHAGGAGEYAGCL